MAAIVEAPEMEKELKLLKDLIKKLEYEKSSLLSHNEALQSEMKELLREMSQLKQENTVLKEHRDNEDDATSSERQASSDREKNAAPAATPTISGWQLNPTHPLISS